MAVEDGIGKALFVGGQNNISNNEHVWGGRDIDQPHLVNRSQRDIVVKELAILHDHQRVPAVQVRHVGVDDDGDEARAWQGLAHHRPESRTRYGCGSEAVFDQSRS